jgi:two-component system, chemotaxis family, protein-glutamate methylesterase/glutaminase
VIRLLVVDDSALMRKLLSRVFSHEPDFEVRFARNGIEALEQAHSFAPDVVTLDVRMPQMDGLECLDRLMVERPCPVVMLSSLTADGAEATFEALRLGAVDFVAKPEGAVSLAIQDFAPELVEKVRAAAAATLSASLRLRERVRHRISGGTMVPQRSAKEAKAHAVYTEVTVSQSTRVSATGDGLVLVGTSTGGPPALEALLTNLPATFPWPIVIAQHMPASFTGPLAARLDRMSALSVVEVLQPMPLRAGHVYLGGGETDVVISRRPAGLIVLAAPVVRNYPWHPSTDRLVRSAMEHLLPDRLIGVLMTGMGYDGAEAMASLRALGGRTIAESEETAVIWGMPGELVRKGGADWVLPLPAIAPQLQTLTP